MIQKTVCENRNYILANPVEKSTENGVDVFNFFNC